MSLAGNNDLSYIFDTGRTQHLVQGLAAKSFKQRGF